MDFLSPSLLIVLKLSWLIHNLVGGKGVAYCILVMPVGTCIVPKITSLCIVKIKSMLANCLTCTFIGLNDVLQQTSLDRSFRKVIDQHHLRLTLQTKIQTSVTWAKLDTN